MCFHLIFFFLPLLLLPLSQATLHFPITPALGERVNTVLFIVASSGRRLPFFLLLCVHRICELVDSLLMLCRCAFQRYFFTQKYASRGNTMRGLSVVVRSWHQFGVSWPWDHKWQREKSNPRIKMLAPPNVFLLSRLLNRLINWQQLIFVLGWTRSLHAEQRGIAVFVIAQICGNKFARENPVGI